MTEPTPRVLLTGERRTPWRHPPSDRRPIRTRQVDVRQSGSPSGKSATVRRQPAEQYRRSVAHFTGSGRSATMMPISRAASGASQRGQGGRGGGDGLGSATWGERCIDGRPVSRPDAAAAGRTFTRRPGRRTATNETAERPSARGRCKDRAFYRCRSPPTGSTCPVADLDRRAARAAGRSRSRAAEPGRPGSGSGTPRPVRGQEPLDVGEFDIGVLRAGDGRAGHPPLRALKS